MEEFSGGGGAEEIAVTPLMVSFKEGKSSLGRCAMRLSLGGDEFMNLLHGSYMLKVNWMEEHIQLTLMSE
ncbi:hypothetical protein Lalb_Chr25g0281421 [Lupinus albus]|uniref:Uncharacterized protein n=1 Tax=Lupinus albus TaxID=3870 RepID=A0A6A4MXW5_LUPAL|nr:hypothetical protein Lalb_Chr25g0281421 [Lupinus albus]